jgi:aspartate/methionine/tyrosine aminotransferase
METMRAAQLREDAGHAILHLEVGQPSTGAPSRVLAAAHSALDHDRIGYSAALGRPELRDRISAWYSDRHRISVPSSRIAVTTGASGSCVLAFLALWDPGARVAVVEPGYPCYRNDLEAFGVEVVRIPVDSSTAYRPTADHLEAAGPLDGVVLASPNNPTGVLLGERDLLPLLDWAQARSVHVVVDEIYHGLTFEHPAKSALEISDSVVVFNSFSKFFSMTGWRLGWLVAPDPLIPAIERLAQNLTISPPVLSQLAAMEAFESVEECERNVGRYRRNRDVLLGCLHEAGFTHTAPAEGAFYIWVDISVTGRPATELCDEWLTELDLAVTPGVDFDSLNGEKFVRFSLAGSEADIAEAGRRLLAWSKG